jgi:glycosyltransferase involved in cell wall biosynthesis
VRICKVYDGDYPWDIRVEKIGRALVEGGHQVFLAVRNQRHSPVLEETVHGMAVRRMAPLARLPERVDTRLMFPAFFSPRWLAHIAAVARRNRCEALLIRDLPLALAGIAVGKVLRIPVVVDLAENYPAALRSFQVNGGVTTFDRVARNPHLANIVEAATARTADHLLVVCEEMREKMIRRGVPLERVTLVGNTPDLRLFKPSDPPPEVNARYRDRFVLLYVGEVALYRGLDTAVDALPALREQIPEVLLVVIGRGSAVDVLPERAAALGVGDHLDMVGFRPHEELPGYIARGDVCLIPHHRNEHIDSTLPNKLFDYMAMGRVIVATDARPLERVIAACDCGRIYRSGDAADLARVVAGLRHPGERARMGENGRRAVGDHYNWMYDTSSLLRVFTQL